MPPGHTEGHSSARSLIRYAIAMTALAMNVGSATHEDVVADRGAFGLVTRACAGDRRAFDELYRKFAPLVHGVLVSGLRFDEVDDAVQEVFLAAWRGLAQLRDRDHVGAWLATIARNRASRTRERTVTSSRCARADSRARSTAGG